MLERDGKSGGGGLRWKSPKTVLGFFAIILGILWTATAGILKVLLGSTDPAVLMLVPQLLYFSCVLTTGVVAAVGVITWFDPTKLQLGQMSGEAYVDYTKLVQGDSSSKEYLATIPVDSRTPDLPLGEGDSRAVDRVADPEVGAREAGLRLVELPAELSDGAGAMGAALAVERHA